MCSENGLNPFEPYKSEISKEQKPLSRFQSFLVRLKTSIHLFGEVLTETKNLSVIVEDVLMAWKRVFVVLVTLILTIIGAIALLSSKM